MENIEIGLLFILVGSLIFVVTVLDKNVHFLKARIEELERRRKP